MKVLVVYDSVFGNTKKVAQGIGEAFVTKDHKADCKSVNDLKNYDYTNIEMIIIGSPTRAFKPTKAVVDFIKGIDKEIANKVKFGIFDTRMDVVKVDNKVLTFMVKFFGYADSTMMKLVKKRGGKIVCQPKGFIVEDSEGPLSEAASNQPKVFVEELLS